MFILSVPDVNWLWNALFGIFSAIDSMIYGLVSVVTQGFFNLSYIEIFSSETIKDLTARIYVVLAVFMVFKLAFSLIQYVVNPDQVSDKQAGMGKLVSRTATAFILLIAVPIIFDEFLFGPKGADPDHTYQAVIARAIPRIILGSDEGANEGASMGETMAATAYSAFVRPNSECSGAESLESATVSHIAESTTKTCAEVADGGDKSIYAYEYQWGISTIVGLVMLAIMLFFTVDVAIRAIKLGILRVVAPIPIITYVDPKSAKDGAFNNWLKALISTYLEMFIKIAIIYIVMFIIIKLTNGGIVMDGLDTLEKAYAMVFIILGLLFFTVQATSFIKNIFGIKDQGMGVGLGMLLGGAGALLAGGGVAGVAQAMAGAGMEGAQGKSGIGNFNKGKQLAEKTAKGQATAQRRTEKKAAKLGYDDARMGELKAEASAAENDLALAQARLQANPNDADAISEYQAATARSKKANKALEDAKEVRKNPALAVAQGRAYTKSGYARALAMAKGASAARGAGHAVGEGAKIIGNAAYQNMGAVKAVTDFTRETASKGAAFVQGTILDSDLVKNVQTNRSLYEQDRVSGGNYLNDVDERNRKNDGNFESSRSIQDYASDSKNAANFTMPNQQQNNNNNNT